MLPEDYLKVLLGNPTPHDLAIFKKIMELLSDGEKEDSVIFKELLKCFPDIAPENDTERVAEKKARTFAYKLEESGLISINKKKKENEFRPIYSWKLLIQDEYLKKRIFSAQLDIISDLKVKFSSNEVIFYCENMCRLYTFEQMVELDGHCNACKTGALVAMTDDQKRISIKRFVEKMPTFLNKAEILADIFQSVFPDEYIEAEVVFEQDANAAVADEPGSIPAAKLVNAMETTANEIDILILALKPMTKTEAIDMLSLIPARVPAGIDFQLRIAHRKAPIQIEARAPPGKKRAAVRMA